MPQPPGPRRHGGREPCDVEQLVHEMCPMVDQYAAAPRRARPGPRRPPRLPAGVSHQPVDRELAEVPASDRALTQPFLHPQSHPFESVLLAWHYDPVAPTARRGDAVTFRPRERLG